MKRIVFNHLQRWWWLWLVIAIANFFMTGAFLDKKHNFSALTFQLVLWLGAMQLNFDLQRGLGRVQTTLPVTIRQISRAWWIFSVALPALVLVATSGSAMLVHSLVGAQAFPWNQFALAATSSTLSLGAIFFLFAGMVPNRPQTPAGWLRYIFLLVCLFGIIFIQPAFDAPKGILVLMGGFILTLAGWFQAEQMVVLRATFRPGLQSGKRQPGKYQAPGGFGGLSFICQTLLTRAVAVGGTAMAAMVLMQFILHGGATISWHHLLEISLPGFGSFGYFFVMMFILVPMINQLRLLRTMPVTTSAFATMLVFLPIVPVFILGLAWGVLDFFTTPGRSFNVPAGFFIGAALVSLAAPLFVWQGMKGALTLLLLLMLFFASLPLLVFATKIPVLLTASVSLGFILLSFALTRRLLTTSSNAYRPSPATGWGGWR